MKLPKAYLDYINRILLLVKAKALLMEYEIVVKHKEELKDKRYPKGYSAEVNIDTRYLQIDICISGKIYKQWKQKKYKEIVWLLVHEIAHVHTDPYYEFYGKFVPKKLADQLEHLNEQQTERLAKLIMLNIKPHEYL